MAFRLRHDLNYPNSEFLSTAKKKKIVSHFWGVIREMESDIERLHEIIEKQEIEIDRLRNGAQKED